MSEPIQDQHQETTDTAVGSTDLLAPERCAKCGYFGHNASDCEYPFQQGHKHQQVIDAVVETCDCCGDYIDLSDATFTGRQALCRKCNAPNKVGKL